MVRSFAVVLALLCLAPFASAQTSPAPTNSAPNTAAPKSAAAVKKAASKIRTTAKPPTDNGACDLGVISVVGSPIGLQKIGITIFGNEYSEVPSDAWGIDDLIVARVQAAAGAGITMRRIPYNKETAYELYEKPGKGLFNDPLENLTAVVRQVTANSRCARYVVVTRYVGRLAGTNQTLQGIGVLTRGPFGRAAVFAYFRVTVFDGHTFAVRDDPFGNIGARLSSSLSNFAKDEFLQSVEGAEFPASPAAAANDARLRDAARNLVAERLTRMLPEYLKQ